MSVRRALLAVALVCSLAAPAAAVEPTTLTVFAAASLTAAFEAEGAAFESAHPGTKVVFDFAGSPTLVQQIRDGAPADVFASADEANMKMLADAGAVTGTPAVFARNRLEIVVGKGNPKRIATLADLARPRLVVVLCGDTVPAGRYALEAFRKAGVTPPAGSRELDVKAVVSKVALGEADAGIVYVTDVRAARHSVEGIPVPESQNVVGRYPIAALGASPQPDVARSFVQFVLSAPGQAILGDYGFLTP